MVDNNSQPQPPSHSNDFTDEERKNIDAKQKEIDKMREETELSIAKMNELKEDIAKTTPFISALSPIEVI